MQNNSTESVVVVGAGTGGVTAALAAAELGAGVMVIDRDGGLGGVGTRAGIHFYYWGQRGGLQDGLDKQSRAAVSSTWGQVRGYHPVAKQVTVESRLVQAGVEVMTNAVVGAVHVQNGRITAVEIEHPEGRRLVRADVVIDATGNGDVAALSGARYDVGRDWDQVMNPYSFVPRFIDEQDRLTFANFDCGWLDSTDPDDTSRALAHGRDVGLRRIRGRTGNTLLSLGPQLGIREGRRIRGMATVQQEDVMAESPRTDVIFRCRTHHDTHARDYANESDLAQLWVPVLGWRRRGLRGDIPYGALVSADVDGLLIGCRAFSGDQDIAAGVRMQRDMHRLGEAAGVAAGIAVRLGLPPRLVPVAEVQDVLRARGVLDELPASAVSQGPQSVQDAIALLGQDEEADAWWWLRDHPDSGRDQLVSMLSAGQARQRRGAAFALAIRGDAAGLPELRRVVRDGDDDAPGDPTVDLAAPRWLAALLLLRIARDPGVLDVVTERLAQGVDSATALYLLHYLRDLAPEFDEPQRIAAKDAIELALARPGLGEDFVLQSSERWDSLADRRTSVRWNLELTASAALDALGFDGAALREHWRHSELGAARRFVRRLECRQASGGGETQPPLPEREADVVVAGGGLAGVAAALEAASSGAKVLLAEPGPVLGHEVTAARRTLLGAPAPTSPLLLELARRGCVQDGHLDAMGTAVALDELCAEAGIDVLLLAPPSDALDDGGRVAGLRLVTIGGGLRVRARSVIDATSSGRVLGRWASRTSHDAGTGVNLVVRNTTLEGDLRWAPADSPPGSALVLHALPAPGWARATVLTPVAAVPAPGLLSMAASVFDRATTEVVQLRDATLALPADEPLAAINGQRRLHDLTGVPAGLHGAGAFDPLAPGIEASDRDVLEYALRSGISAARAAVSVATP